MCLYYSVSVKHSFKFQVNVYVCLRLPIICTHKSTSTKVAVDSLIILFGVLSWHGLEVWCFGLGLSLSLDGRPTPILP